MDAEDKIDAEELRDEAAELFMEIYDAMDGNRKDVCATALAWALADICLLEATESSAKHDVALIYAAVVENIGKFYSGRPAPGMMN